MVEVVILQQPCIQSHQSLPFSHMQGVVEGKDSDQSYDLYIVRPAER